MTHHNHDADELARGLAAIYHAVASFDPEDDEAADVLIDSTAEALAEELGLPQEVLSEFTESMLQAAASTVAALHLDAVTPLADDEDEQDEDADFAAAGGW